VDDQISFAKKHSTAKNKFPRAIAYFPLTYEWALHRIGTRYASRGRFLENG